MRKLLFLSSLALLLAMSCNGSQHNDESHIYIISTNDMHANIDVMPRLATLVKEYEAKGEKRYATEIMANDMKLLGRPKDANDAPAPAPQAPQHPQPHIPGQGGKGLPCTTPPHLPTLRSLPPTNRGRGTTPTRATPQVEQGAGWCGTYPSFCTLASS